MSFAETLRRLRTKAGLSQRDLALKAGVGQKSISWWETGESEPTLSNLQKLCTALGVTCDVFFDPPSSPATSAEASTRSSTSRRPRRSPRR